MLAGNEDRTPPSGVPAWVLPVTGIGEYPALRNVFTSARTRLSLTRFRSRSINATWSIESKHVVGSLQHDIVTGHTTSAAQTLRQLAPTYDELAAALS